MDWKKLSGMARLVLVFCLLFSLPARSGEPQAPALLLAQVYGPETDPSAYWVSEKYDGVRAYWDGRRFLSRSGREIQVPDWFTAGFPGVALDGELWLGRRRFDELAALLRQESPRDEVWRQVRYLVFELPGGAGTFSERYRQIETLTRQARVPWLQAAPQFRVGDRQELEQKLRALVAAGGEGLMLHLASAPYQTGRSPALLKLTPWLDAEATVVAHLPGKGRYQGMLGALLVETPAGIRFRLGSGFSTAQRREPPPVGSRVTYRYRELTPAGVPRFASFLRPYQAF